MAESSRIRLKASDERITEMEGDSDSILEYADKCKEIELGKQYIELEKARRPQKLVEAVAYIFTRGGKRDVLRQELEMQLKTLDFQCKTFDSAVTAMLRSDECKAEQFQAICRALPEMVPEAQAAAMEILKQLSIVSSLPRPEMPRLEWKGKL